MISCTINGKSHQVESNNLETILTKLSYLKRWSAVEVNGEILNREILTDRLIENNDVIEVVSPVGGGNALK